MALSDDVVIGKRRGMGRQVVADIWVHIERAKHEADGKALARRPHQTKSLDRYGFRTLNGLRPNGAIRPVVREISHDPVVCSDGKAVPALKTVEKSGIAGRPHSDRAEFQPSDPRKFLRAKLDGDLELGFHDRRNNCIFPNTSIGKLQIATQVKMLENTNIVSASVTPLSRIVERRLAELDINPFEADRRGGLSKGFVNDILIGRKNSVRTDNAKKLAKALNIATELLMDTDRAADFDTTAAIQDHNLRVEARKPGMLIPEIDVRGGAGYGGGAGIEVFTRDERGGIVASDATRGAWMIPDYFLASGNMRASRTHILAVDGPSMMPDLNPTDRVVVDLDDQNPGSDGIFAVWDGDTQSVILKNVQVVRGADPPRIKCISSNTTYEPFEVILDGASRIIGRVKYRITAV